MTLYDAIFSRRQVRKFRNESLDKDVLGDILLFVSQAEHLKGQNTSFELVSGGEVRGGPGAPYYLPGGRHRLCGRGLCAGRSGFVYAKFGAGKRVVHECKTGRRTGRFLHCPGLWDNRHSSPKWRNGLQAASTFQNQQGGQCGFPGDASGSVITELPALADGVSSPRHDCQG